MIDTESEPGSWQRHMDMVAGGKQVGGDHYLHQSIQPWDAMQAWMTYEQFVGFLRGNAIKYLARAGSKGSATEDFAKARHYMDKLEEVTRGQA
jgi:uncharacterized iron-regulated protein